MILEDFVMLGKTVPEPNSDGRIFVCSAGWSSELRSIIRIYPLARRDTPPRWSVCRVQLQRNTRDSRSESWQLAGDRTPAHHDTINTACFEITGSVSRSERASLFRKAQWVTSIAEANERRMSLALIHPVAVPELFFEFNPDSPDSPQLRLFDVDNKSEGARRFAFIPRLRFRDERGEHRLMLRDWGCYELMRRNGDEARHGMGGALHLSERSSLLIGNLNNQRTAWLVISVLNGITESNAQSCLELDLPPIGAAS